MPIEKGAHFIAQAGARLVVPAVLVPRLKDAGQLGVVGPLASIAAALPVQLSDSGVLGEQMQEALSGDGVRLRIGQFFFGDAFKPVDAVRFQAAILKTGATSSAAADENPQMAVLGNRQTRIVMWIVDAGLIVHDHWSWDAVPSVIVVGDHA